MPFYHFLSVWGDTLSSPIERRAHSNIPIEFICSEFFSLSWRYQMMRWWHAIGGAQHVKVAMEAFVNSLHMTNDEVKVFPLFWIDFTKVVPFIFIALIKIKYMNGGPTVNDDIWAHNSRRCLQPYAVRALYVHHPTTAYTTIHDLYCLLFIVFILFFYCSIYVPPQYVSRLSVNAKCDSGTMGKSNAYFDWFRMDCGGIVWHCRLCHISCIITR